MDDNARAKVLIRRMLADGPQYSWMVCRVGEAQALDVQTIFQAAREMGIPVAPTWYLPQEARDGHDRS
jgi:hypothetical protein